MTLTADRHRRRKKNINILQPLKNEFDSVVWAGNLACVPEDWSGSSSRSRQALNRLTAHPVIFSIVAQNFICCSIARTQFYCISHANKAADYKQQTRRCCSTFDMCPTVLGPGAAYPQFFHFCLIYLINVPKFYRQSLFPIGGGIRFFEGCSDVVLWYDMRPL